MKKITIIFAVAALVMVPNLIHAQFSKGQLFLGNTFSFSTTQTPDSYTGASTSTNSLSIGPLLGVFINDKWAIGLPITYSGSFSKTVGSTSSNSSTSNTWGIGLLGRRYITLSEKVFIAIEGRATYSKTTSSSDLIINGTPISTLLNPDTELLGFNVRPILVVFPSPSWAIEGGFSSLNFVHSDQSSDQSQNSFTFSLGTLNLGVSYFFKRK